MIEKPAGDTKTILGWKSKGLSYEITKSAIVSSNNLDPKMKWINNSYIAVEFNRSCFVQDKVTYNPEIAGNLFIFCN